MKILIVDDEPIIFEAIKLSLRGYDLTYVDNGQKAVSLLNTGDYEIVVLDLQMPGTDGISLLTQTQHLITRGISVIVLTTYSDAKVEACFQLGVSLFLTKPFNIVQFRSAILYCIGQRRTLSLARVDGFLSVFNKITDVLPKTTLGEWGVLLLRILNNDWRFIDAPVQISGSSGGSWYCDPIGYLVCEESVPEEFKLAIQKTIHYCILLARSS